MPLPPLKKKRKTSCFFLFWGCPALRAGRAVSQLAGLLGPAGFFASLQKPWVCRLAAALLSIPQPGPSSLRFPLIS
nr:hypothetical protein [Saprospira grandis]